MYFPGSPNRWIFIEDDPFVSKTGRAKFNNIGIAETHQYYGLWDHSKDNQNIKNLLNDFEISSATTESLSKILKESFNKNNDPIIFEQQTNTKIANYFENDDKDIWNILFEIFMRHRSVQYISRKYQIHQLVIQNLWSFYRKKIKAIKKDNRRLLGKNCKLTQDKIKQIADFWIAKRFQNFTINDVRLHLVSNSNNGWSISNSSVGRSLKRDIGMTYKKINKISNKVVTKENKRKILEASVLQMRLMQSEVDVVYIDEFKFSWHRSEHYGWSLKGTTGYSTWPIGTFQASFIVAFSEKKIHGIMPTKKTFNSKMFKYFIIKLIKSFDYNYALIWDNARIHVSELITQFLIEQRLLMITIPAYSPVVNACENLILNIKAKVRKLEREGKEISLATFKRVIDSIQIYELEGCIKASFKEAYTMAK